jgi:pimeloyl-ACP methyl ester carboxylesterase
VVLASCVPELRARGHNAVAPDLPSGDDSAGLSEYTDVVVDAIGDRRDLVVVGQSFGGFTGPLVCACVPVRVLVPVAAMVPSPGESPGDWWANTGWEEARREQAARSGRPPGTRFDAMAEFFHDVAPEVVAARGERVQSGTPFTKPWPLPAWPAVPTRFLLCRDDRFFPAAFMRRVAADRLHITPDEMDGGHLPALHHPVELADRLIGYWAQA